MQDINYGYDHINQPFFIKKERFYQPRNMITNHYHDAYEIYYMLEGERYYFIEDRTYHIKKGNLVLIDLNQLHKTMDGPIPDHERILVNFKQEFLPANLTETSATHLLRCFKSQVNFLELNYEEQTTIQTLLLKMVAESRSTRPDSVIYLKLWLAELLLTARRTVEQQTTPQFQYLNPRHQKISEIVRFINANYALDLSLSSLAERSFISKYYLSHSFKEVTGFTLVEYLNSVRTREAQKLLRESKLNITAIATAVGFESATHFGRVFKTINGMSPLKYRRAKA